MFHLLVPKSIVRNQVIKKIHEKFLKSNLSFWIVNLFLFENDKN